MEENQRWLPGLVRAAVSVNDQIDLYHRMTDPIDRQTRGVAPPLRQFFRYFFWSPGLYRRAFPAEESATI